MSRYGASTFSSLLNSCVLWAPLQHSAGVSGDIDEFPILPSGVTVINNGTFTKTDLGNNKSVLNFDGSTNYIDLSDNAAWYFGTGDFTIACWVKSPTLDNTYDTLFGQCVDGTHYWVMFFSNTGTLQFFAYGTSLNCSIYTSSFTRNTWFHVTLVRSGTGSTSLKMYINNVENFAGTNLAAQSMSDFASPLYIGCHSVTGWHTGNMKDLMIWKGRALTQPEIKLLMNRTHPITGTGLMPVNGDYWRTS